MIPTTLRIIVKQSIEWNSSLHVNFVDYENAFDSLDKESLWELMKHYVMIPEKFVTLIRNTYEGMTCKVAHAGKISAGLEVLTIESGRAVFYHHSSFCWLLTVLQERLQQTRETESSGHC